MAEEIIKTLFETLGITFDGTAKFIKRIQRSELLEGGQGIENNGI